MKLKTLQKSLTLGIFAISSGFTMQAMAAPVFSFTQFSGFSEDVGVAEYTNQVVDGLAPTPIPAGDIWETMSWRDGDTVQSSLVLSSQNASTGLDADVWTRITTLQHNNIVIPQFTDWADQNIWGRIVITDSDGGPNVVLDDTAPITVSLTETWNNQACPPPNPNGSSCDDYFIFTAIGLNDLTFQANDGSWWQAQFRLSNLQNAILDGNIVYTAEGVSSSLDVEVLLTAAPVDVPEPATLSILGLGLLGLGMVRRRKLNA